eukprot:m.189385 g.189385  ORF g.189385 m.189385 type:complete len:59 (-) comp15426_c0_seq2:143-319(-)
MLLFLLLSFHLLLFTSISLTLIWQDEATRRRLENEMNEARFTGMPAWKRAIIEKKEAV